MRRKYDRDRYGLFAKVNRGFRNHCAPDPTKPIKETGKSGKIIGSAINNGIEKPIGKVSYALTGLSYNPEVDSPYKGSILYTIWNFIIKFFIGVLFACGIAIAIRFFTADILDKLRISFGFVSMLLIIIGIKSFFDKVKSIFSGDNKRKK